MRIIELSVGKKKIELVAGLVWHPVQTLGSARAKEIKAIANVSAFDLKVLRGTDSAHVGFAKIMDGAKSGQVAAAAVIADTVSQAHPASRNFLVALRLPGAEDEYIFVAVREGVILADGDIVGNRDEICVRLTTDSAYDGWSTIICPSDWGVANSKELAFAEVFSADSLKAPKHWALSEVNIAWMNAVSPVIGLTALIAATYIGYTYWTQKQAALAEAFRIQQAEVEKGQRATVAEPIKPWPALPSAVPFAQACNDAFRRIGLVAGNWEFSSSECSEGQLTATWSKTTESAWISHFQALHPNAHFAGDGQTATITLPVDITAANDYSEQIPVQAGITLRYYDLASRYGMAVRVEAPSTPSAPIALPGQQLGQPVPSTAPPWALLAVQVSTSIGPAQAAQILTYPGLRIQKITYANKSGQLQYQLTGVQYVRP